MLKAARELSKTIPEFVAQDFVRAASIEKTDASQSSQIATAWLSKLARWGYLKIVRKQAGAVGRPMNVYVVTKKGRECDLEEGIKAKFDRLVAAAVDYKAAHALPTAAAVRKQLFKVLDEVSA
jgi:hypothetical protein